jgi:uncharacterized protein YggE
MRTTLTIEDDAFSKAQAYADARALKLGQAVSELIRRGTADKLPMKQKNGAWVFDLPPDTPKVTARQVKDLIDDERL